MVDHRPSNYGLQAPQLNRGPTTAALTGHFFFNPLPEFTPRLTTCSDEVITEDSFSPSKISSSLRCLILLLYPGAHQKLASIKWHYLHERQLPNNLSPTLPFYLQSRACTQKRKERKDTKKERNSCKGCWSHYPSFFSLLHVKLLFSRFCNILGGFSERLYVEVSY